MASVLQSTNDCCSACTGISVTVTTTTAAVNLYYYDTIALLRAGASPTVTDAMAVVKGSATAFDGLGGNYAWQSTSTTADDGINFIKPNDKGVGDAGRWRKLV